MASEKKELNSYIRNIIAPLVFPDGHTEKDNAIYGMCPDCGAIGDHCSIVLVGSSFGGHCVKCEWTLKKFRAEHPEHEQFFSNYSKWIDENGNPDNGEFVREHIYTSESGRTLYRKQIFKKSGGKKYAIWATLQQDGVTFVNNIPKGKHAPIYHLDEISKASSELPDSWIYLTEGEKDADGLRSLMHAPATCLPNGAINLRTKIHPDWLDPFAGQRVIVVGDNDPVGDESADALVKRLLPVALVVKKLMPTDLLRLPFNEIAAKKKGYDVSDYIDEVGHEVAYQTIKKLSDELPTISAEEPERVLPDWVIVKVSERGNETRSINEPMFCNEFKKKYKVSRINGIYYSDGESVTDDFIMKLIQGEIQNIFVEKTGQLTQQLNKTLENTCYAVQPAPDDRKIYCRGSVSLLLDRAGNAVPCNEEVFSLTRLPVKYKPSAVCPTFEKYLSDLFYEEDIPVIQEFLGYCLVPCTRAQAGLFIHGKGGEGKSVLRDVIMRLFGHAAIQESIHQFEERFTIANLENRLVSIDDDMQADLLGKTGTIKKLITAKEKMQVERKNKQKYESYIFARVIGIGNSFIGSKFDHSEGFYRRQLLIDCKPKTRSAEEDDSFMSDKCVDEIEGIFVWALEGLRRLMQNNYHFSVSDRMKQTIDDTKKENDNTLAFFEDTTHVVISGDWTDTTTSADLFAAYAYWCRDNNESQIKRGSFQRRIGDRYKNQKIKVNGVNGYKGILLPDTIRRRVDNKYSEERAWLDRLP